APEQWNHPDSPISFYHVKGAVDAILHRLNIEGLQTADAPTSGYQYGLTYLRGNKPLVTFGAIAQQQLRKADVDGAVFFAEFNWELVLKAIRNNRIAFRELSKFPAVRRDLSLLIDSEVS